MAVAVVTGATGFIGHHLIAHLRALNWQVIGLARQAANTDMLASMGAQIIRVDVTDRAKILAAVPLGADVLFHLACAPFGAGLQADYLARVNEDGLRNVLFAATDKKVTCTIYMSDAICYGEQASIIDEHTPMAPLSMLPSPYARSRRECEAIFGRAIARGLEAVSLMSGAIIGDGLRFYRRQFFEAAIKLTSVQAPTGGHNFVDVESVVQALIRAAERGMTGQRYFVGGTYQSWEEMLQRFIKVNGLSTKVTQAGYLGQFTKILNNLLPTTKSVDHRDDWIWSHQLHLSTNMSQTDLGFQPRDIDAALKKLYASIHAG
jgi:dihydroflavonol-4-reductase